MISYRPARVADVPGIAAVFGAARAQMTYLPSLHTPEEDVASFSDVVAGSWVCVADADGVLIGFCAVREGWVNHLYVNPDRQGQGVGSSLLSQALQAHTAELFLWVFEENHRALTFYKRHGFAEVERTDGRDNEERVPDIRMCRSGDER